MQKQQATILSAKLSGFQSLAENLPPEEITPLMSDVHDLIDLKNLPAGIYFCRA